MCSTIVDICTGASQSLEILLHNKELGVILYVCELHVALYKNILG